MKTIALTLNESVKKDNQGIFKKDQSHSYNRKWLKVWLPLITHREWHFEDFVSASG